VTSKNKLQIKKTRFSQQ